MTSPLRSTAIGASLALLLMENPARSQGLNLSFQQTFMQWAKKPEPLIQHLLIVISFLQDEAIGGKNRRRDGALLPIQFSAPREHAKRVWGPRWDHLKSGGKAPLHHYPRRIQKENLSLGVQQPVPRMVIYIPPWLLVVDKCSPVQVVGSRVCYPSDLVKNPGWYERGTGAPTAGATQG